MSRRPPVDVEIEKPHLHHRRIDIPWYDLAIPIAALFVSFISIYIAWHHGKVMQELVHQNERLVEANSLPYLQLYGSNGTGSVSLNTVNEGVGPAKIVSAEVLVDRHAVRSLHELLLACCGPGNDANVSTSTLSGRMVRPGDSVKYIDFEGGKGAAEKLAAFDRARLSQRIVTRLCYCSVFNDCWIADSHDPTPDPVNQCVPLKRPYKE